MASTRMAVAMFGLTLLVCMALILIVLGQQHSIVRLLDQHLLQKGKLVSSIQTIEDRQYLYNLLQQQQKNKKEQVEVVDAEVNQLIQNSQGKKTEVDACQAEMTKRETELTPVQKELTDTKAAFKPEKESWTAEITNLKQQIEHPSPICSFVQLDPNVK